MKLPDRITEQNYPRQREVYESLALDVTNRTAFRDLLLEHLVGKARLQLQRGKERLAWETFEEALELFDPVEIYQGTVRAPGLNALAAGFIKRFAPRGDEEVVLPTLMVRYTLGNEKEKYFKEFKVILDWVADVEVQQYGPLLGLSRPVQMLEKAAELWPAKPLVAELRRDYLVQFRSLNGRARRHRRLRARALFLNLMTTGRRLAQLYLRVNQPKAALAAVTELKSTFEHDQTLLGLLRPVAEGSAEVRDYLKLAGFVRGGDKRVGLRICREATRRFPEHPVAHACVAQLARELERPLLAERSLERAVALAPDQYVFAADLFNIYRDRVYKMVNEDRLEEARAKLEQAKRFVEQAEKRYDRSVGGALGQLYHAVGHGFYNQGKVERAEEAFRLAVKLNSNPDAVVQLARIQINRGRPMEALSALRRAEQSTLFQSVVPRQRLYWEARFWLVRAAALELSGDAEESQKAHAKALARWAMFRNLAESGDELAESFVFEAQSLYALGKKGDALAALDKAIDTEPQRKETYADVIAMLTTRGHLPEALDALHRALGRQEVTEYLKSYCSFWIVGLSRRAGLELDPRVKRYLEGLQGTPWYVSLAGAVLGRTTFAALEPKAKGVGERAELYYYWSEQLAAEGKLGEAQQMWKKVRDTDMMAFFEYDKAVYFLRRGLPEVSRRPVDRKAE